MPFTGSAPDADELEITVFGRGYGECAVCHVGGGAWLVVDSFRDVDRTPIAVSYLRDIAGDDARVAAVVATHWDGDHIAGLGEVLDAFDPPEVWIPAVLREREAFRFAYVHDDAMQGSEPSGLSDFVAVADRTADNRRWAITGRQVAEGDTPATIRVLTPIDQIVSRGFAALGALGLPGFGEVTAVSANATSVVLSVSWGDRHALLGADLEKGPHGWQAVLTAERSRGRHFQLLKVPHHGSPDADSPEIWTDLCLEDVNHLTSRYTKGVTPRPSTEDRDVLRARNGTGWLVGAPGAAQLRQLDPISAHQEALTIDGFWEARGQVGAVRVRCRPGGIWRVDPTGAAQPI